MYHGGKEVLNKVNNFSNIVQLTPRLTYMTKKFENQVKDLKGKRIVREERKFPIKRKRSQKLSNKEFHPHFRYGLENSQHKFAYFPFIREIL